MEKTEIIQRDWYNYFLKNKIRNIPDFLYKYYTFNTPLIGEIEKLYPPYKNYRICEVGSGSGLTSILLASRGYLLSLIDKDPQVLDISKRLSERFDVRNNITFLNEDAFTLYTKYPVNHYNLCFSHGVLEHFPYQTGIEFLKVQGVIAEKVLTCLPGKHTEEVADQIYYDKKKLIKVHQDAGLKVEKFFNYGDLPLWFTLLLPPLLQKVILRYAEVGSVIGIIASSS
jgi:SAM-dependent methyltransferase